ncbi:MAG: hypothetical protein ACJ779_11145 [Chloroflexota bacterium]
MTTVHDEFLGLAAASIDFDLTPAEGAALATHLADCVPCRRQVKALEADQRAMAQLPTFALAPGSVDRMRGRIHRSDSPARPMLRLLAVAAILALLAMTAFTVGAELLRRERDRNLTDVPPTAPIESALASPGPDASHVPGVLAAGSLVDVVVSGLRVRTLPTVDNSKSVKLDPLLGVGTQLQIIEGPVTADDYDWYLVQAIGLPHRGWVAAADHDGSPWVEDSALASSSPSPFAAVEADLIGGLRRDAAVHCTPRRKDLPNRATAGVECRLNSDPVDRFGAYRFQDAGDAALTYLERLASNDVAPATGDCSAGTSGDSPWMPGDGTAGDAADRVTFGGSDRWVVGRSGCFLDEDGTANVRLTCGPTYVGIVGRNEDLAALHAWAWRSEGGGRVPSGEPPGICSS